MGLDYSFIPVAELRNADQLIRAVAARLPSDDSERLISCLPYSADKGLKSIRRYDFEQGLYDENEMETVCLQFLFPMDAQLAAYAKTSSLQEREKQLPVGCVGCSIRSEKRFCVVRATAATSAMSRLFAESSSVKNTFTEIGRRGGALVALLDDEQPPSTVGIWPYSGRLTLPSTTEPFGDDDSYYTAFIQEVDRRLGR
jgi:hypothetical protein